MYFFIKSSLILIKIYQDAWYFIVSFFWVAFYAIRIYGVVRMNVNTKELAYFNSDTMLEIQSFEFIQLFFTESWSEDSLLTITSAFDDKAIHSLTFHAILFTLSLIFFLNDLQELIIRSSEFANVLIVVFCSSEILLFAFIFSSIIMDKSAPLTHIGQRHKMSSPELISFLYKDETTPVQDMWCHLWHQSHATDSWLSLHSFLQDPQSNLLGLGMLTLFR